jgi:succinate-acetate transporter protein
MAVSSSSSLACGMFCYDTECAFADHCREMAVGNTFGATALSSYGGFWISFAILLTPGGFEIESTVEEAEGAGGLLNVIGFFLMVCLSSVLDCNATHNIRAGSSSHSSCSFAP